MSALELTRAERRQPCASCKQPILEGARKCKHCKQWQPDRARAPRSAVIMAIALTSVFSVIVTTRESPVGEAPPLTTLPGDGASSAEPSPAAVGPEPPPAPAPAPPPPPTEKRTWKAREIKMGDVHPLDLAFSKDGKSLYVSADDATIREYQIETGEMVHKASVPAKGDRIELLFDRYIAVLRRDERASRVPVLDTTRWDYDPVLLEVGAGPGDIRELEDGTVVVATTASQRVSRFLLPSGRQLGDIKLPQSTGQLFYVKSDGHAALAALGGMTHAGRPAGAWVDLFDPAESPFGATRRSVAVGRDPRSGSVTADGSAIFFPDFASNTATLMPVSGSSENMRTTDVGQGPIAGFVMAGDQFGVTLNATARTASVVELGPTTPNKQMRVSTLMLSGEPRMGRLSRDGSTLFVSLGGLEEPPRAEGVAIIAGDPPEIVDTLPTGKGAISVAAANDLSRAAVANYFAKSITVLE
ncbi:MAG: hypothetical protein IPM79_19705 [Polyangiaceae bacterium]|jgi:DNA-binding beta-propeller fold protein YncE|nr:hypothetical protein [Polyangiaceae bacterium]MBK8939779.1 hypothetical protein [Polyangiaceae bacterium]